jgi:hypothetical protein
MKYPLRVITFIPAVMFSLSTLAQPGAIAAHVMAKDGTPVGDAVIVAVPSTGLPPLPAKPSTEIVDQINKEFVPRVKPILVGSFVEFPNQDHIRHEVYSFSTPKPFELPLYAGKPAKPLKFDKPGVVVLGCNIHDWMIGYIYVSESPYFAKTDANGAAELHLPDGGYSVRVWHPQMKSPENATQQSLTVAGSTQIHWTVDLKPEIHVHRGPSADNGGPY